eukprot:CAMPEP_0118908896 /NCGR_PEP_ID=MMETSP1166-20130328/11709_1 /TAXON_ID=1104430 /ORGANISM="Chrysoreinhardia sp, Strain CCMP3193" /LENGTH=396 /DNA_ID=CAMNT_0006848297 /DNA_START=6 /DNA_END=1196 /DNA_ORIENTATION=+
MPKGGSDRWRGALYAFLGIAAVSPDGALIRWAQHFDATGGAILFTKSTFGGVMSMIFALTHTSKGSLRLDGWPYLCVCGLCQALLTACFTLGFAYTYAANVTVLSSFSPLLSAILGKLFLRDDLPPRTLVAIIVATLAVLLMFETPKATTSGYDDLEDAGEEEEGPTTRRRHHAFGNACGILAAVFNSIFLLVARMGLSRYPDLPVPVATASGALLTALATFAAVGVRVFDAASPLFYVPMLAGSMGFASVQLGLSIAPRYATAADVSTVSLVGLVLSPLWVALFYDEIPPPQTVKGGAILLLNLLVHEGLALKETLLADDDDDDDDKDTDKDDVKELDDDDSRAELGTCSSTRVLVRAEPIHSNNDKGAPGPGPTYDVVTSSPADPSTTSHAWRL